jgi:GT2 family glycosyltransferase
MKVISFCLWGDKPIYNIGLIENAKLAQVYYPDWECWAYIHEKTVPKETIQILKKYPNVKIIFKTEERIRPRRYMLWRFEPADYPIVTHFISRDTDSRISPREVLAVQEWIESGKTLHIMRDHPQHYPKILGGMFGIRCSGLQKPNSTWSDEVDLFYQSVTEDSDDQEFLSKILYSHVTTQDCVIHDENKLYEGQLCRPFPLPYEQSGHFVGCYVSENNVVDPETSQILKWFKKSRLSTTSQTYEEILQYIGTIVKNIYVIGTNTSLSKTLLDKFIPVSSYTYPSPNVSLIVKENANLSPDFVHKLKNILDTLPETWTTIQIDDCYLTNKRECKISVIIPTYNRYEFLVNAIQSVKQQTYQGSIELIIVNDGSTQPEYYSPQLRDLLPQKSILIHMTTNSSEILVGKDGRAAYTRNVGLKVATGEYIAFLDDDDYWLPEKLQKQLDAMTRTGTSMSCTEGYIGTGPYDSNSIYPKYHVEYHRDFLNKMGIELPQIFDRNFLVRHNFCINSSVIIHKDIVDKIGFFPYKAVGEDYSYWLNATEHTDCVFLSEPMMYYDMAHGNGSQY